MVVAICVGLANWQWQRAHQKQQRLDNIQVMQEKGLMTWKHLNVLSETLNKTGLQLTLTGKLHTKQYWLLDNRTLNGRHGYDLLAVMTPQGSEQSILVNFGWVALGTSRDLLPNTQLPEKTLTFSVQLKQGDLAGFYLDGAEKTGSEWPKLIQFIDIDEQAKQSDFKLVDYMAYAVAINDFAQPHYEPVVMPPQKHIAYALQWLLIAFAATVVFVFAMRSQYRNHRVMVTGKQTIKQSIDSQRRNHEQ